MANFYSPPAAVSGVADNVLFGMGTGNVARFSWDTTDANANALFLQLPTGGGTDVPAVAVGVGIESVDLGLYDGVVDPTVSLWSTGARATAASIEFRKSRGTNAARTIVTTGDDVGSILGFAATTSAVWVPTAAIIFDTEGSVDADTAPGTMVLRTGTTASPTILATGLTIDSAQLVTLAAGLTVSAGAVTLPAESILNAAVEDNLLQFQDTQLNNAAVKALGTTPQTIVATPGSDRAIVVHKVFIHTHVETSAWVAAAGDDLQITYTDLSGALITADLEADNLKGIGENFITQGVLDTLLIPVANAVVVIGGDANDWTGGDGANTLSIRVWYSEVDTVAFS